jgi:alpha-D-ribose 1-methylphosphonate 5-triphosphate synthase subunit PhnH
MKAHDLSALGAGFSSEAHGSQSVFRAALQALSHPGRCVDALHDAQVPSAGHPASAALLLAMLDADCTLWLSPTLARSDAALWLHFHTGCQLVDDLAQAQFVWVAAGDAMPELKVLPQGTEAYPDQSATCVVDVLTLQAHLQGQAGWCLRGPGIQGQAQLRVEGVPADFLAQWSANHARFPRGVDVFLAAQQQLVGLPRTTAIEPTGGQSACM